MDLANQLQLACKRKGWTITILSRMSDVPQATLHGWTTGRSVKNLDDLKKVSSALEIGLHELVFGSVDPYEKKEIDIKSFLSGETKILIVKN